MKKNIGFINADITTLAWLREKLKSAPAEIDRTGDLVEGISELLSGESSSLMIGAQGGGEDFVQDGTINIGVLSISSKARTVKRDGKEIMLTPKEFDILYFLAKNRGEVFTKEQIYKAVWDDTYLLDDSNIMAFIRKLRKKIELNPDSPEYILTIWGIGYKFNDKI